MIMSANILRAISTMIRLRKEVLVVCYKIFSCRYQVALILRPNTHCAEYLLCRITYVLCTHAKHRRSGGWSAANSSSPSCVIAKNSAL